MTTQFSSVDQALRKAKILARKGALGEAQAAYRWVLENFPNNKRALEGLQALGAGRSAKRPSGALPQDHANALVALHRQGRSAEALERAKTLAVTHPNAVFLHNFIGICQTALGQADKAVASYKRALALTPEAADIHANLGDALNTLGRPEEAAASFRRALALNPGFVKAHNNLGNSLIKLGDVQGAANSFARAAKIDPGLVDAHANLGLALVKLGRPREGEDACRKAIDVNPDFPLAYVNLAHAHDATGNLDAAIGALEKAIALKPDHVGAHSNLCELFDRFNRTEDMRAAVARAREHCNTNDPRILFRSAQLAARDKDHAAARSLLEQMPDSGLTPAITKGRLTLLGKTCDKLGDHAAAFDWFRRANDFVKSLPGTRQWNPESYRHQIEALAASFFGVSEKPWADAPGADTAAPVFLVGFPRSGTTLLDTILRSHPDIVVLEEMQMVYRMRVLLNGPATRERLEALSDEEIAALREAYLDELRKQTPEATERTVIIDKLPLNIVHAGLIHRVFPQAKFIFAMRHPCDCVLSCYMQNFALNDPMANFLDLEASATLYDQVMRLWSAYRTALPLNVHELRYEDLIADLEGTAKPVLEFLDLDWDDALLNYRETALARGRINTPSYNQVTEKLHKQAAGRWENYRTQMEPVLPSLDFWARKLGY